MFATCRYRLRSLLLFLAPFSVLLAIGLPFIAPLFEEKPLQLEFRNGKLTVRQGRVPKGLIVVQGPEGFTLAGPGSDNYQKLKALHQQQRRP